MTDNRKDSIMELLKVDTEVSITLKALTDLIGVEHNKAMKKVEELAIEPSFGTLAKIATVYNDKGQTIQTYSLTKKQAIAVGARLNNSLLMLVIDKLEEMEQSKNKPQLLLPQNYLEALEALTVSVKENISLTNTIKAKDEVILAAADLNIRAGDVSIGDFSKNLAIENLGRNNLFSWLKARGFLMMNTEPYQQYVERGYFVRKPSDKRVNGEVKYTTMLTPRGTVWLTKMLKAEYDLGEV